MSHKQYQKCIDACIECATICNHCAISCLEEKDVQYLTKCIRLDLECAVICRAAAELMSLDSRYSKEVCQLCATICDACAEICEQHANMGMEHCRECAEACRACAKETMETYQALLKQDAGINESNSFIQYDECAVITRATAELISLDSTYGKDIAKLNATICNEYAEEFGMHVNMEMKGSKEHAKLTMEAHQELESQDQKTNEAKQSSELKSNESGEIKNETNKKKNSYSSALLKAYMMGNAVSNVRQHSYKDGNFANMGTNLSYRENQ